MGARTERRIILFAPHRDGVKCVVVDVRLKDIEPMAYNFLMNFARDNELQVREGRGDERPHP